ncbi:MAG: ATP-binding protein [Firmicutes bacterium]|nr:ATP-binding protein [Bacillota bacterium]
MNGTPKLRLTFHGRIIDHLGIQMYQSPVAAVAELISNAWDADAEKVEIFLPDNLGEGSQLIVLSLSVTPDFRPEPMTRIQ